MKKFLLIIFVIVFPLKNQIIAIGNLESPKYILKKKHKAFFDRINLEFSFCRSYYSFPDLILRASAVGKILRQYSNIYNITYSQFGKTSEKYRAIPFMLTIDYNFKKNIHFRIGFEYFKAINKFTQTHKVDWGNNNIENISFDIDSNIKYYAPFVGAEYSFYNFGVYVDLNITLFKHHYIENITYDSQNIYSTKTNIITVASPSPIGLKLGVRYSIKIIKGINAIARLEFLYSNISGFTGEKSVLSSDNTVNTYGVVYKYDTTYSSALIPTWDILDNADNSSFPNLEKMTMSLSRIRLIVGISF